MEESDPAPPAASPPNAQGSKSLNLNLGDSLAIVSVVVAIFCWALFPTVFEKWLALVTAAVLCAYLCYKSHWSKNRSTARQHTAAAVSIAIILGGGGWQLHNHERGPSVLSEPGPDSAKVDIDWLRLLPPAVPANPFAVAVNFSNKEKLPAKGFDHSFALSLSGGPMPDTYINFAMDAVWVAAKLLPPPIMICNLAPRDNLSFKATSGA